MNRLCLLCALIVLSVPHFSFADEGEPAGRPEPSEAGGLSLEVEVIVPTSYVFRGYVLVEDHLLVQPEVTVSYETQVSGLTVTPYFAAWGNLTDASAPGDPEWFNELDLYLGVDIDLPHGFTLGLAYDYYNSPANVFDDVHEIGLTLKHDDLLQPAIGIYRELQNQGADENTYIELSITPGFDVPQVKSLRLEFPMFLGLTPDEYYTDSDDDGYAFGFASAGITATFTINEQWALLAGADYIQMLADSTEDSNDGDEYKIVGRFGVKYSH